MSAPHIPPPTNGSAAPSHAARHTIDLSSKPVPFARLAAVEWRKLFDTRANLWLFVATSILVVLTVVTVMLLGLIPDFPSITANAWVSILGFPISLLLPIFAILIVTSEWGQRSHLTLFTLEPNRFKVIMAKLVAVFALALAIVAFSIVVGAIGNVAFATIHGHSIVWDVGASDLLWQVVGQLGNFLIAFALASLLLNSPLAIVAYYALVLMVPLVIYSPLMAFFDWARTIVPWIDFGTALSAAQTGPLRGEGMNVTTVDPGAQDYLRLAIVSIVWIGLPLVLGIWRVVRSEVK